MDLFMHTILILKFKVVRLSFAIYILNVKFKIIHVIAIRHY